MMTADNPQAGAAVFLRARDFVLANRTDYDRVVRDFQWPILEHFNWATDYFDVIAAGNNAPALVIVEEDGTKEVRSFDQLVIRSNQVANYLRGIGLTPGDRLLLMLGNEVPLWEIILAAIKLRIVVCPASTLLTSSDLQDRIDRGRIRYVVTGAAHAEKFSSTHGELTRISVGSPVTGWARYEDSNSAPHAFTPEGLTRSDEPLLLYFTSGTTSKPKLILHTHQSYPIGHLSTLFWLGLQPGDRHWNISSPGWAKHAWSCFFSPWNAGATVFTYNYKRMQPRLVLEALVKHEVTTLCAPPTVWRMLIQEPLRDYGVRLREVMSAGEPLNPEVIRQVQEAWGLTLRDGYGQTETTALVGNSPGQPVKAGSMGRPLPGYDVVLVDGDGQPATEGEICLRLSPRPVGLTPGYADHRNETMAAMGPTLYHTGDVAQSDADGYLTYVGRADDLFKASDYRLSPFELESALIEHVAVAEAAVVPSPDPVRAAVPKAFVTLAAGYSPSRELARDILAHCRDTLAPYKRIRRLEFCELPKTVSGKIRRVELRIMEQQRRAGTTRVEWEFFEEDFAVITTTGDSHQTK